MNRNVYLLVLLLNMLGSCHNHHHHHEADTHENHEEIKFQYTAYTTNLELFVEADAFIVGEKANILSHFSLLPDFRAVETGKITMTFFLNGKEIKQTLDQPTRKGICSFDITPEAHGKGKLTFEIVSNDDTLDVEVPEVIVFSNEEEAHEAASKIEISHTNTTVFTKEQSWKVDFASGFPQTEPFGQVIKTTALVQSSQSNEIVISAKTNGIVQFNSGQVIEGKEVSNGQSLFTVSGGTMAENNIAVKYAEAKNNFEKASADYERAKELAKDKIVSEKELLSVKNQYENSQAIYNNLNKNFNPSGQTITSPQAGFIKQVFVKNGAYVEAGQPVMIVSQTKSLVLTAELPSKYVPVLANIHTANIRSMNGNSIFSLEQLNGKVLSYGKAANNDNFLIPVNLQIENNGNFVSGSFVEVYLKTISNNLAVTVPNDALLEEQGNYFVWVQITPELFEKREVSIGGNDGLKTEIRKGIIPTDRIVTRGAILIKLAQATGTLDAHSGHVH